MELLQKLRARLMIALAFVLFSAPWHLLQATNLTGTFKNPDGSFVSGKLIFLLSQPARLNDSSAQVVPMVKIFSVDNGVLEPGAFIYGNDVLVPSGTYYLVRLVDNSNNLLFEQKWSIQGVNLDLGTLTPTTTGVVVPDPLLRNVTTDQIVQGPVTFNSDVTAFSLTLNGNFNPGTSGAYDLGNGTSAWREVFADRWNGMIRPGAATGFVTAPTGAPALGLESASGGAIAAGTYYFCFTYVNQNGETPCGAEGNLVVGSGSTNQIAAHIGSDRGWRTGAFAFRLYASTSPGGLKFLQTPRSLSVSLVASGITRASNIVTATVSTAHGLVSQMSVTVSGVIGCGTDPNGTYTVLNVPTRTTFTFTQTGGNETCGSGGTVSWKGNIVLDANTHMVPGELILDTLTFSGSNPPGTNTATIDADQVALNTVCDNTLGRCNGTVQYNSASYAGTTPLIVAIPGARIRGHGIPSVDVTSHGTRRDCSFANANLGCVMVMGGVNGVDIKGLNVRSASNGYYLYHNTGVGGLSTFGNEIDIGMMGIETTGSLAVAPIRMSGKWFYLNFDKIQFVTNTTATRGQAGIWFTYPSIAWLKFTGNSRWTIRGDANWIRNDRGKLDADRNTQPGGFVTVVDKLEIDGPQAQCAAVANDNAQFMRLMNVGFRIRGLSSSDCSPDAGMDGALIELGADADAGGGQAISQEFYNMNVGGDGDAPSTYKLVDNAGGVARVYFHNSTTLGSSTAAANFFDMNNLNVPLEIFGTSARVCNPFATADKIINIPAVHVITCRNFANTGASEFRTGNNRFTGGVTFEADDASAGWHATHNGGTMNWYDGDTASTANRRMAWGRSGRNITFYEFDGSTKLFELDQRSGVNQILAGHLIPTTTGKFLGNGGARWAGSFTTGSFDNLITSTLATGTPPFSIASTTEVTNLNAQNWHGKQAIDFSATLDFASVPPQTCSELTITASGASADNPVVSSWPAGLEAGLVGNMRVSASDTITVRLCNITSSAVDPASRTFAGRVVK